MASLAEGMFGGVGEGGAVLGSAAMFRGVAADCVVAGAAAMGIASMGSAEAAAAAGAGAGEPTASTDLPGTAPGGVNSWGTLPSSAATICDIVGVW
jgi:hypothetical protein